MKGFRAFIRWWPAAVLGWLIVLTWFFGGHLFYRVAAVEIHGDEVIIARTFPLPDALGLPRPTLAYYERVRRLEVRGDNAIPCILDGEKIASPESVGRMKMSPWSDRCRVQPYKWEARLQVLLFGIIPLRAIPLEVIVLNPDTE